MNIAIIGYGRMGREIERIALERGHQVALIIDLNNASDLNETALKGIDVAIEFTTPETAVSNYLKCFSAGVPVVSGSTGWLSQWNLVSEACAKGNAAFFYASNFSLGVNLFFELNRKLAKLMHAFEQYKVSMTEIHHTKKLDAPSGTAISLAESILAAYPNLKGWEGKVPASNDMLGIQSVREGDVPGIHTIRYESDVDFIEITHSAKSRVGFAFGAVLAAEYSVGKKGILTMEQMLNFNA